MSLSLQKAVSICNRAMPYLYVAYSTRDADKVYPAVLAMQNEGINLWIDVPQNFNTGKGYNSSIFEAMEAENCKGILFFMSESAMTSAQTCKEIAYAESPTVRKTHNIALPLTVVELVELEDHDKEKWVEGELYQRLKEETLSKEEYERIEKYRKKYNTRLEAKETKYDLAKTILDAMKQYEANYIIFESDSDKLHQTIIKEVAKHLY